MQKVRIFRARGWRVLFLLLTVLLAGVIFYMSSEPATESSDRSTTIAAEILPLVHPAFETLPPEEQKAVLSSADHILRKTAHFCVYGVLGVLLLLYSLCLTAKPPAHMLRALLAATVYAASDEIHQAFVPGRGSAVTDVLLDSAGALCGILFIWLLVWASCRRTNKDRHANI